MTNGRPAFRLNDSGVHAACCNTNMWNAAQGSATVLINNKAAVRLGDQTKHCGGMGKMIEGSVNVMIGGSTTAGGGGGGGGSGGGGGGAGTSSSRSSTASGSSSAAGGGSSAAGGGASHDTDAKDSTAAGGATSAGAQSSTAEQHEPDNFTLWMKPEAINGGTLAGETVALIDPETKQIVAQVEVDDDGHVLASVPDNKAYDVQILGHADDVVGQDIGLDASAASHLAVALFDALGNRLGSGVEVIVRGMGHELRLTTDHDGTVIADLDEGSYEIEVNGQTFHADTLRSLDVQHEGGGPYQFQLAHDDKDPDYAAIEQGRQHRISAAELKDLLEDLE